MSSRLSGQAYLAAAWLFLVLIPVQFYFAAAGSFSNLGFSPHQWLGLGLHAISGLLIVIALVGRLPRRALEWSVLQFILISGRRARPAPVPRSDDLGRAAVHKGPHHRDHDADPQRTRQRIRDHRRPPRDQRPFDRCRGGPHCQVRTHADQCRVCGRGGQTALLIADKKQPPELRAAGA